MPVAANVRTCLASGKAVPISIYYEDMPPTNGVAAADAPTILLAAGLGATLHMHSLLFPILQKIGYRVIAYDNRDTVGRSTTFSHWGTPYTAAVLAPSIPSFGIAKWCASQIFSLPYTLESHALDALALLDFLKIGKVVLLGSSMGGAIISAIAAIAPERVCGFIPLHSSTFHPSLSSSPFWVKMQFLKAPPANVSDEALIKFKTDFLLLTLAHGYLPVEKKRELGDEAFLKSHIEEAFTKIRAAGGDPTYRLGTSRQMLALLYSDPYEREKKLAATVAARKIPALAIGGKGDLLFQPDHTNRWKTVIPHAEVHIVDCGHLFTPRDMPVVEQVLTKFLTSDAVLEGFKKKE